ncbi:MAG TPA: DNA methyltransferase [Thermoanaerobaculia bacterium]
MHRVRVQSLTAQDIAQLKPSPQQILNGEAHNWYRIILGFSDHLVAELLDEFQLQRGDLVLDPFCGSGTTLVECMKRGIDSIGIDANPSSHFAAQVKTNWRLLPERLRELTDDIRVRYRRTLSRKGDHEADGTYRYLTESGMVARGWISEKPLRKAIATKHAIASLATTAPYRRALTLALVAEVVGSASNVKFGPELYCGKKKGDHDVLGGFTNRVDRIAADLERLRRLDRGSARVFLGDARACAEVLGKEGVNDIAAVICSPPYPTEHDYTRNSRLELAFLEEVFNVDSLRVIKRGMIRSHTKGIYSTDDDSVRVKSNIRIQQIASSLRRKVRDKTYGFARFYPTVVTEYFGGMKRHLETLFEVLRPGAPCAFVLGDQSSYQRVHISTAELLGELATEVGFVNPTIRHWRDRWATATAKTVSENILVIRKPLR